MLFTLIGAGIGLYIVSFVSELEYIKLIKTEKIVSAISIAIIILFAIIFFLTSRKVFNAIEELLTIWERDLQGRSILEILMGAVGLILGLLIAFLISQPIYKIPIPYLGSALAIVLYGMLGYLGLRIGLSNKDDLAIRFRDLLVVNKKNVRDKGKISKLGGIPKILDTSVIIDGRILDICKTGFLEGPLIVPVFVLEELQHIADSSDSLKRKRGRRGLDVVKELQEQKKIETIVFQGDYEDIAEVDSKLLKLAKEKKGKVVTNDFNLNKVAAVQSIEVLNINELANSVKPVYIPGEELIVNIVREGKEFNQGLGYLDDGTMIVVENGKTLIGEDVNVVVTSALQTSAGKMIFAKPIL